MSFEIAEDALGLAIKSARGYRRVSQKRLAEDVGVSKTHLSYVENGRRKPSLELLFAIASVLNLRPSLIVRFAEEASE